MNDVRQRILKNLYDGPPTVRALNRTADRIEIALYELLPITFSDLRSQGMKVVIALRQKAQEELDEEWPK